jgi:glutathione synthase/RimK-type ligase-like ATP-grasp enzyme
MLAHHYNSFMPNTYDSDEQTSHRHFVALIHEVCANLGAQVEWLSDEWVARIVGDGTHCYIEGYTFPLNNAVAANFCRDKAATYTVLTHNHVPALPHALLRLPADHNTAGMTQRALALAPLPLVIKPNSESGGRDVFKCISAAELDGAITELAKRYRALAVGPFADITNEYRVVLLDGKPLLSFAKIRPQNEWRHNLKHGAVPQMVYNPTLEKLAITALRAIGGRLGAVDIVETPDGLRVIEINGGIMLERFAQHSAAYKKEALRVYTAIVSASLRR